MERSTDIYKRFGRFIAAKRVEQNKKQIDVAEYAGISQSYLSAMEIGIRRIDLDVAFAVCNALDVDMREFVESEMKLDKETLAV